MEIVGFESGLGPTKSGDTHDVKELSYFESKRKRKCESTGMEFFPWFGG